MASCRPSKSDFTVRGTHSAFLRICFYLALITALSLSTTHEVRAQPIFDAVKKGDTAAVRRMIATNPQQTVTALDGEDYRPLHWAATFGKIDIMRLLIDAGADVNAPNLRSAWTPLHDAAWHGHPDAIDVLIQHGARLDPLTGDGNMAIHWAAHAGQTKCITYLLMYGADIDSRNLDGNTPLAVAAWYGQLDTCKLLIAAGADIHSKNLAGSTPIDEAVRSGKNDVAELMKRYDSEMQLEAARQERLKANPLSIRTSYANWLDQKAVTKSVYHQDFAKDEIGSEWSTTPLPGEAHAPLRVSSTPRGHRRFLGDLGSQAVHLNIRGLPAHHEIAVTFDLFILNSWDGNDFRVGPDIWSFSLEDGPTLLNTTFANMGDGRRAVYLADQLKNFRVQSYPDEYPGGHNPLYSGADEVNTLGYMFNIDGVAVAMDAVYKMRYTFRNTDTDITLNFAAHGLQALDDESWGITNVEVSVDSAPVAATKPIPTSAHPTTIIATKPKPTTSRSAVVRKPTRKVTATKRKPTANKSTTKKTSTANSPHDKKKPLTP